MAIPVVIVTGFLGCGKTSFLRHLLPLCGEAGLRPALIINEVGDVDIDGELLDDLNAEQARLVGGCVCCTLQAQLSSTLYEVLERKAFNIIIIECSGLSNPLDVLSVLSAPALLREIAVSHIICLLDAGRADKVLKVAELAKTQVTSADLLILNKEDKVPPERRSEVEALVDGLAPHAMKRWAAYGDIGAASLRALLTDPAPMRCSCSCEHDHSHDHTHHHHLPASFCTVALALPEGVGQEALTTLLNTLPDSVIRAKGFAHVAGEGWHTLHKVYDSIDITPYTAVPTVGAVLICIGQHLDPDMLGGMVEETFGGRVLSLES
ncbi:MAG: CobW family GTP-binding protein [Armatimonadota bacterium]